MKKVYLEIFERTGEFEVHHKTVHVVDLSNQTVREFGEETTKNFYEDYDEEIIKGVHMFNGGCNITKLVKVKEITDVEFGVLSKFL